MLSSEIITLVRAVVACLVSWILWRLWKFFKSSLDVLSGPPPQSLLQGNIPLLLDLVKGWDYHRDILDRYGRAMRITGALGERLLLTFDSKALHHILVKDQNEYELSTGFVKRNATYLGEGLLSTRGEQHRKQRKMMNPVFSINHMRDMTPLFQEVADRLRTTLRDKLRDGPREIDILQWTSRTALELIGQSGMGYSFDTLQDDNVHHPYAQSMRRFIPLIGGVFGFFTNHFIFPHAARFDYPRIKRLFVNLIPSARVQEIKKLVDIMQETSQEIIKEKKDALGANDPAVAKEMMMKKDIISILMKANSEADEADRLTDEEVSGQVSTFVLAGMATTSSALSRILHLLSTHQEVQERLRQEILEAQADGQLTHDQLVSLPYLDSICRETLRLFPPINFAATRTARQDMILPLSKPVIGSDGKDVSEIAVPKGTSVIISILGANTDSERWGADALEWKPERWLSPLPAETVDARMPGVYSHLMTFLGGGRACIGFKFAQLEMKVVLVMLLSTFRFETSKTHEIIWKMTNIVNPYAESLDPTRPQLPIVMSVLD